eukprot:TRINITY_DN11294_c0_g1_i4.p1 TRINITY_DN11294_c0_g1~~TRINITY_DN11294_c0_g1_i4.p1  ORF type:complete len:128 (-),score=14.16 TRINITY_DN11294_c0_g1_i4:150-533(-)
MRRENEVSCEAKRCTLRAEHGSIPESPSPNVGRPPPRKLVQVTPEMEERIVAFLESKGVFRIVTTPDDNLLSLTPHPTPIRPSPGSKGFPTPNIRLRRSREENILSTDFSNSSILARRQRPKSSVFN